MLTLESNTNILEMRLDATFEVLLDEVRIKNRDWLNDLIVDMQKEYKAITGRFYKPRIEGYEHGFN